MILSRCKLGQPADGGQPLDLARIRAALARQQFQQQGTVAKLAMRQPFVLFKGLTFQKLCLP
ncbi:hypothetical protein ACNISU_25240, partial [Escherichia coli]